MANSCYGNLKNDQNAIKHKLTKLLENWPPKVIIFVYVYYLLFAIFTVA